MINGKEAEEINFNILPRHYRLNMKKFGESRENFSVVRDSTLGYLKFTTVLTKSS